MEQASAAAVSTFGGPKSLGNNYEEEEDAELVAVELPPGFRFHPTDDEIIMHYLLKKVVDRKFATRAIGEADLNKCEPWDLPKKAKMGEKEWFFFCQRDRKYPTGMRTNRATESGYWKATGKDREIYYKGGTGRYNNLVGMKKTLVFYKGRAPKGEKTNWVMHEYRLEGKYFSNYNFSRAAKEEWVVCRVFHKNTGIRRTPGVELARIDSLEDHLLDTPYTLPPLTSPNAHDEAKGNITSSSRLTLNEHTLQYDQTTFLIPNTSTFSSPHNLDQQNPIFFPQFVHPNSSLSSSSLGYPQQQDGYTSQMVSSYPPNVFSPFKGAAQSNLRMMAPKMEHFSSNNSVISHSQDTGLSTEITSVGDIESKKPFDDDDEQLEGLSFSPSISDLDSLWSY